MISKTKSLLAPRGWADLGAQLGLLFLCYAGYQAIRGRVGGQHTQAFWNANQVIQLEQSLGIFWEVQVQRWSRQTDVLIQTADWLYLNSHYLVSVLALLWLYHRAGKKFGVIRNSFLLAMALALAGYLLVPTAPPRLMPEWGFHDTVAAATGVSAAQQSGSGLVNMYAAVPSMHIGFALLVGFWMRNVCKRRWTKILWSLYPLLITWVVIATANHYLLDVLCGALVSMLAIAGAISLEKIKSIKRLSVTL